MSLRFIKIRKLKRILFTNKSSCFCSSFSNIQKDDDKETPVTKFRKTLLNGPSLKDFFQNDNLRVDKEFDSPEIPYLQNMPAMGKCRKVYFDIYGCQMNVNDTEIIWSILKKHNYFKTRNLNEADVVLMITCAIREGAETKIWNRLEYLKGIRNKRRKDRATLKIGILGCMAERLKHKVLERERTVDVVAGPDSYKDLPRLLALSDDNQTAINVQLSIDETYADVMPMRLNENAVTAFVSIMRGCDNMCTYCIVPFTRGRERSRPISSILDEVRYLSDRGVREVTLLGQNVNSYRDLSEGSDFYTTTTSLVKGFKTVYKPKAGGIRFATLLEKVASIDPEMRVRFTSPHPKDFSDDVLEAIKSYPNVCKNLHLPAQSGNSNVLERMRRGYTRESYLELVDHVRSTVPDVALTSDFICGFCGETEEEFDDTISLLKTVRYNMAYLFPYSMREKTTAHRRFEDDVPPHVKQARLERMVDTYRNIVKSVNYSQIGERHLVLVEGVSKRSELYLQGRNDSNCKVIFPIGDIPQVNGTEIKTIKPGDYVVVHINAANSQVLKGIPLYHTTMSEFYNKFNCSHNEYLNYSSTF
ncbi:hypothetical protein PPYR_12668 [Photinus pyralis]|uniref:CDK5RAP1-like protein n=1 Tax=Photinus pyralis TaxID=7054 RepID=A0A5N4A708_PHOPY|nr:CDK5RAP1-like protein [Photinus pyralis]KAB0793048.1 hypothetical protein PPYR_12668 [Photinus pyralis]